MSWTESRISKMLSARHKGDIFVAGCKDGPTTGGLRILDGWAMPRSWAHPHCIGYEIKVSRSDWLGDKKWPTYLPLCHQLYVVCPHGLLTKDDVPDPCGLMYACDGEEGRLIIKKRAALRNVTIPEDLFRYVLMYRCQITNHDIPNEGTNLEAWREWLADKREARLIGRKCSKKLARLIQQNAQNDVSQKMNEALQQQTSKYNEVRQVLSRHGLAYWSHENLLEALNERLSTTADAKALKAAAQSVGRVAKELAEMVEKLEKGEVDDGEGIDGPAEACAV